MKSYLHLFFGILIAGLLFYRLSYKPDNEYVYVLVTSLAIAGEFALIASMRRRASGKMDAKSNEDEEEIDFSKNSPSVNIEDMDEPPMVKPIDLTGNVFDHNIETMNEDLGFLEDNDSDIED